MRYTYFIFAFSLIFVFSACTDKAEKEQELLEAYLADNGIDTEPTASGLYYIETLEGTGDAPEIGSYVTIVYEGRFIDGEVFDSADEEGFTFRLGYGQVITGMDEGVSYMREGGMATLIIPSYIGYGSYDQGDIPAYSTLIFDLALMNVGNQ